MRPLERERPADAITYIDVLYVEAYIDRIYATAYEWS
jgi:hypothetical protein